MGNRMLFVINAPYPVKEVYFWDIQGNWKRNLYEVIYKIQKQEAVSRF